MYTQTTSTNGKKHQVGWMQIEIVDLIHVIPGLWVAAKILHQDAVETSVKDVLHAILWVQVGLILKALQHNLWVESLINWFRA